MGFYERTGKLKALTLSFDDGVLQDIRLIELINKYGLKCTFNLNSGKLGERAIRTRNGIRTSRYIIAAGDVKEVYAGHEVAGHTLTHPYLTECDDEEVIRQVEQDRVNLSNLVGYEVLGMPYPSGRVDGRVESLIRNHTGVKYCRTTVNTDSFDEQENLIVFNPNVNGAVDHERLMELTERFIALKPDKPQIFYVWGHAYEFDYAPDSLSLFEAFCKRIARREDIFYGTNAEVLL